VILRIIFRMIWLVTAFCIAALVALAVLFALGAIWVGDELRAAAPDDPLLEQGAPIFGVVLFAGTVGPALTALLIDRRGGGRGAQTEVVDVLRAGGRGGAGRHSHSRGPAIGGAC
jgi:hypothetical protein